MGTKPFMSTHPIATRLGLWLRGIYLVQVKTRCRADRLQVKAELAAADGRIAASASRPCMATYRSPFVRFLRCGPRSTPPITVLALGTSKSSQSSDAE